MTELQPKLLTPVGQYDMIQWPGRNTSGIKPRYERVLVLPDQASSNVGGVFLPPETIERLAEAAETGVIVAVGADAWKWNSDRSRRCEDSPIPPGTRVYFERYAGGKFHGRDGLLYRLMDDKCIGGEAVEPEGEPVVQAGPASHVSEALALQDAIARGHVTDDELPEIEAPPLLPDDLGPPAVTLEARAIVEAAEPVAPPEPRFPVYLTRNGVLTMAYSGEEMRAKGDGLRWYATAEAAKAAYASSSQAHVDELVRAIKAS